MRVIVEGYIDMAAAALLVRTIIQLGACVCAGSGVTERTGLRTIGVTCLCISMAEPAGGPLQRHIGYIRHGVQVVSGCAFPDMAYCAVYICCGRMGPCAASIIRSDRECIQDMAALALCFSAVIKFQTGVVAGSCVAYIAWLEAIGMDGLGVRMAETAGGPIQWHVSYIRHAVQVIGGYAFPDMAHSTIHVCRSGMCACATAVVGVDGECVLDMTAFTLGL